MNQNFFSLAFSVLLLSSFSLLKAQNSTSDSTHIRKIFNKALSAGHGYKMLDYLSNEIGGRLSGSPQAAAAVDWTKKMMEEYDFDTVYLQEVMVPHWERGEKEEAKVISSKAKETVVAVAALGGSVPTDKKGIKAQVIEVQGIEELQKLGKEKVQGKIVFFNRPMEATQINAFNAYGGAVDQRVKGPSEAAKLGALGAIVRSMSLFEDDFPHTGTLVYDESANKIPAVAISTKGANLLSKSLSEDANLKFFMKVNSRILPDALSHNVIGEIRGSEVPEEIIVVSGHLDSWDLGDGAHDDGAGCVQAIESLRLFKALGIKPKRTVRAVMYMNEENGLRGGQKYAELAKKNNEDHIAAIESDNGGFSPRGFEVDATPELISKIQKWEKLFKPYDLNDIGPGYGGADIGPLKNDNIALIGLKPDSQRYFYVHHASTDTFDQVNRRELEMGAASMASILYLLSEHGLR